MITGELVNTTDFGNKADRLSAYKSFLQRMCINQEDFPFTVKTGKIRKGKEIIFNIRSWGFYEISPNSWRIFVAYYYPGMKHLVQYTWHVGSGGLPFGDSERNEWIGG